MYVYYTYIYIYHVFCPFKLNFRVIQSYPTRKYSQHTAMTAMATMLEM